MAKKRRELIKIFACILPLLVGGFCIAVNLVAFLSSSADIENFIFSLLFLSSWIAVMIIGVLFKSKLMIKCFRVFWIAELIYLILGSLYVVFDIDFIGYFTFVGAPVFLVPIVGMEYIFPYDYLIGFFIPTFIMIMIGYMLPKLLHRK